MNKDNYFEYKIYQCDKFCFRLKIFFIIILLLIIGALSIFLIITKVIEYNIWNLFFLCLVICFSSYLLYEDIKYLKIIENQIYRKLILDNHNNIIKLIDKSDNIIQFGFCDIKQVQIKKYKLRSRCSNIAVLGKIEFSIEDEKYSIIISDINNFIQNSIFQNVTNIKSL